MTNIVSRRNLVLNLLTSLSLRSLLNADATAPVVKKVPVVPAPVVKTVQMVPVKPAAPKYEEIKDHVCRADGNPGVKGLNYDAYAHKDCKACEAECEKLKWCVAYECSDHPATCNIWACQPKAVVAKHGHTCRWKIGAPTLMCAKKPAPPKPAPVVTHPVVTHPVVTHPVVTHPPPPAPVGYDEMKNHICRSDTGLGIKGLNYDSYHTNCAGCKAQCDKLHWCVAYQCSDHPATCNIWACQPTFVQEKHGTTCRWKKHAPNKICAKGKPKPPPAHKPSKPPSGIVVKVPVVTAANKLINWLG